MGRTSVSFDEVFNGIFLASDVLTRESNMVVRTDTIQFDQVDQICEDREIDLPADFMLQSGQSLNGEKIRLRLHGAVNGQPIVVLGGISAGKIVADAECNSGQMDKGWWANIAGPKKSIDTENDLIIGVDFAPLQPTAPVIITTHDQARIIRHCLDQALGFAPDDTPARKVIIVGASYGGMIGLAFAALFPDFVEKLFVIGAGQRAHPFGTAFRGVQRRIIEFAMEAGEGGEGVALARQLAMISYRSLEEFGERFAVDGDEQANGVYPVCSYLVSRGDALSMSAERYLSLSDSIDRHLVDPAAISVPVLLVAIESDQLSPPKDIEKFAQDIKSGARFEIIKSLYGHDGFLKETEAVGDWIKVFLESDEWQTR